MNRRTFLALIPAPFIPASWVAAKDDEVEIPVEDCPCCCTVDEGVTWYSCDGLGNPLEGDPAGCESNGIPPGYEWPIDQDTPEYETPDYQTPDEDAIGTEHEEVNWSAVELPNTGSGPEYFLDQIHVESTEGIIPGYIRIDDEFMLLAEVKDETTLNVVRWIYPE